VSTDAAVTESERDLQGELRAVRERVERIVVAVRGVDAELEACESEREQFALLEQACDALGALAERGAGRLFWEQEGSTIDAERHLSGVHARILEFGKRIAEIESRRQELLDELQLCEDDELWIAGDILEAERLAEQQANEWVIERELDGFRIAASTMPWARGAEEDARFRKTLAISLLVALFLGLVFPLIDLPIPERWQVLDEQERLTQLIREERPLPPPVEIARPEKQIEEPTEPVEPQEPTVAQEAAPAIESSPAATPSEKPSRGILAFREEFSSLATHDAVARLGTNARIDDSGDASTGLPERSMVTTRAPGSSGGINVAELSRGTGGTGNHLAGVATAKATSTIGSGTGGSGRPLAGGGGPSGSRTDEEIQIVFDRHKAALYRLYNRALRKNPMLKGQIVLRLTIEPDGSVSLCELKSSDMQAPELAQQVVDRVRSFDFGAKEGIPPVTIVYPIDFLPAT
jgi:outer membrane biosynthesis protein TonB